jgi:acetoacetyl-CoA synthetase
MVAMRANNQGMTQPWTPPVNALSPTLAEGTLLWQPTPQTLQGSGHEQFRQWLARERGLQFNDYLTMWQWSIDHLEDFWECVWDFAGVVHDGSRVPVLASSAMPGARWYPNAQLNFAEHLFKHASDDGLAIIARSETSPVREVSWQQLKRDTAALAHTLRSMGVVPGDRVVSCLPNWPEAMVAFFACASLGAVWSSCSPDMGVTVVLDRFVQIEPKVLLASESYGYGGKLHDRSAVVTQLLEKLPTIEHIIHVAGPIARRDGGTPAWRNRLDWAQAMAPNVPLRFERLPFDHPLWIVYSSGTTGLPKPMVHGHGGVTLIMFKDFYLQHDVRKGDRMMYLASTGWIVWNLQVGCLCVGATAMLVDGQPTWPNAMDLWRYVNDQKVTLFGCGSAFLINALKEGVHPHRELPLASLRCISATGSPLPPQAFQWVNQSVKPGIWIVSMSGGTDIAAAFVCGSAAVPVRVGELSAPALGVAVYAFNEAGKPVVDEVGELVVTKPMPSMPLYFWGDEGGKRYRESYFEMFPGVWRHGDWIRFTPTGSSVIYGRSDSTINRHGIRMGTAEIYRVVEALPEVRDSLVIDLEYLGRESFMPLFVVLAPGAELDEALRTRINLAIKQGASARHVPNVIVEVAEVPRTLTGKKMEVPVRKILLGQDANKVASPDAMANPKSLAFFTGYAATLGGSV